MTLASSSPDLFDEVLSGLRLLPHAQVLGEGRSWQVLFESGAFLNVDDHGRAQEADISALAWQTDAVPLANGYACGIALGGAADAELVARVANFLATSVSTPACLFDPDGQAWILGEVDGHALRP